MKRRVVVTGMGIISPIGSTLEEYWHNLVTGRSGIDHITRFDTTGFDVKIGGEVKKFDPTDHFERKEARKMDRFTQYGAAASMMALQHAGIAVPLHDPLSTGVCLGTGIGGMETLWDQFNVIAKKGPGRVSPFFVPMMISNMAACMVSMLTGAKGPNTTITTACAASTNAIGEGFRIIQRQEADVMIVGGCEATFVPLAVAGFASMKALSTRNDQPSKASRPFDKGRDGFVMGEGAGILILESLEHALDRGAAIYAEVLGYGMTADAYHLTAPSPGGEGGSRSMKAALADAGLKPSDIDYINAHGTSTPANDKTETESIKNVFGPFAYRIPISSTKSMTGHLLGASGAIEAIACILSIRDGQLHPTINYEEPDPCCDLDYVPNVARKYEVNRVLSNSFGFGGQNATLILGRFSE